jgi:hypothetical protein
VKHKKGKIGKQQHNKKQSLFPFQLLQGWVKSYSGYLSCALCQETARFQVEHYVDVLAVAQGQTNLDRVWSQAVTEQSHGRYQCYFRSYYCQGCIMRYLTIHAGANAATFAAAIMHLGMQSVLLGSTLQTPQDEGEAFTALTTATQIEDVAKQLRLEPVHIKMKG